MSILWNDGLEEGPEHMALSICIPHYTRLLIFMLYKTRGWGVYSRNNKNNNLKQRIEHAAESNSSCSHLGMSKM